MFVLPIDVACCVYCCCGLGFTLDEICSFGVGFGLLSDVVLGGVLLIEF